MATHPYISGVGNVARIIGHLRKSFPASVTSETVKKLGLASNNESYVINALQFIGLIDEEGKRTDRGHDVMTKHNQEEFELAFGELVEQAYKDLFELRGSTAWESSKSDLIGYFRAADKTSEAIGTRQANLFQTFAALAGHGEVPQPKPKGNSGTKPVAKVAKTSKAKAQKISNVVNTAPLDASSGRVKSSRDMALTVRIEINLPAEGTRETYDNIFQSIRANLINE